MAAGSSQGNGGMDAARIDVPARPFRSCRRVDELPGDVRADPPAAVVVPVAPAPRGTRSGGRATGDFRADEQPLGGDAVLACARTAPLSCFLLRRSERADAVRAAEPGRCVIALPGYAQIVVAACLLRRDEEGVGAAGDVEEPAAVAVGVAERNRRGVAGQAIDPG